MLGLHFHFTGKHLWLLLARVIWEKLSSEIQKRKFISDSSLKKTGDSLDSRMKNTISFGKILILHKILKHEYSSPPMGYTINLKGSPVKRINSLTFRYVLTYWIDYWVSVQLD